jgi:hypothetical protein
MGKRRTVDDDEDGDDYVPRVGRPRSEEFGPPKPDPHDRKEYAARLQGLLDAIEIPELGRDERRYLQRVLWRSDRLESIDKKRFPNEGAEQVTHLLRLVFESTNGSAALKLPILRAVSDVMYPAWLAKGLAFIESFDLVDLVGLHDTLLELGLEDQLARTVRRKLEAILGPPVAPPSKPKSVKVKPLPKARIKPRQSRPAARMAA